MFVTFHMKSGNEFTIEADDLKTRRSNIDDQLIEYEVTYPANHRGRRLHTISMSEIEAITVIKSADVKKSWWR